MFWLYFIMHIGFHLPVPSAFGAQQFIFVYLFILFLFYAAHNSGRLQLGQLICPVLSWRGQAGPVLIVEARFQEFTLESQLFDGQQGSVWVNLCHSTMTEKSASATVLELGLSGSLLLYANHSATPTVTDYIPRLIFRIFPIGHRNGKVLFTTLCQHL